MTHVAIIYYSATGNVRLLAEAVQAGAERAGAETRLRRVAELAPEEAIQQNPKWAAHRDAMRDEPLATLADLEWADGAVFGSPTRFGNVTAQLKQYLDQTGGLWARDLLTEKVVSGFTSASTHHGGLESTLLALYNTFYHWGSIIVPPGYGSAEMKAAGNPYGASHVSIKGSQPEERDLAAARFQGQRVAEIATRLAATR